MQTEQMGLAGRIRAIREEVFGAEGCALAAQAVDVPCRTWMNYEAGVVMPGTILLRFIAISGAEPKWLHTGEGPRFSRRPA